MKNKKQEKALSLLSGLSQKSGIPVDMLTSLPLIKMMSNREIYIEDAGKILKYDTESVCITQRKMTLEIKGRNLSIKCLADTNICVCGYIEMLCFITDGGENT